jgi:redox-sensitive bicupin YhaK (pirin superfamily)
VQGGKVFGIQAWVALPRAHEEVEPAFAHHGMQALPLLDDIGYEARLIIGSLGGVRAPVDGLFRHVLCRPRAAGRRPLPLSRASRSSARPMSSRAASSSSAPATSRSTPSRLVVFAPGEEIVIEAVGGAARLMLVGGEPMDGPRHLWWNFVSSSNERIEQAKADWKAGRFAPVPDETEFIPLPEAPPKPVSYP